MYHSLNCSDCTYDGWYVYVYRIVYRPTICVVSCLCVCLCVCTERSVGRESIESNEECGKVFFEKWKVTWKVYVEYESARAMKDDGM